jgi:tyrosinase
MRFEHPLAFMPYWDSTVDAEMPNPRDSSLWTVDLMGAGDGNVTDGPFSGWSQSQLPNFPSVIHQGGLFRAVGAAQGVVMMNKDHLKVIFSFPRMQLLTFCVDPYFDTVHASTHIYLGGLMSDPATSPGEPLFYLFHAFVDWIWEAWRKKNHPDPKDREQDIALPCPYQPFDLPDSPLFPFDRIVRDGYSNIYPDEFWNFQEPPECENSCWNSPYMVCLPVRKRCMAMIRVNGDCSGLEDEKAAGMKEPCYKSTCQGGKCVAAGGGKGS